MSDRGFQFRRLERRKKTIHPNAELAEVIAKIRAESATPPPIPHGDVQPPPIRKRKPGFDAFKAERDEKIKKRFETLSDEEQKRLINAAKGNLRREGIREETVEAAGRDLSNFRTRHDLGLAAEAMERGLRDRAERLKREQEENESARDMASRFKPLLPEKKAIREKTMIERLDEWIGKENIRKAAEGLNQRLLEHFPASFEKPREINRHAQGLALAIDEGRAREAREATRAGLGERFMNLSRWMHIRYDSFKRTEMVQDIIGSRAFRYGMPLALFAGLVAGAVDRDVHDYAQAHVDSGAPLPGPDSDASRFAPPDIADATHAPKVTIINPSPGEDADSIQHAGSAIPGGDMHEVAHGETDDSPEFAEPIEVQGNVSVWGSLLDGLNEKGIDLGERGEQAFAHAVQQAIEDTGTQSSFIEYKGEGLSDAAWDKIPDGATIHFDLLFGNLEFLDRLKELLESPEYRSLGKEVQSLGGADAFISDLQDAFGVRYL